MAERKKAKQKVYSIDARQKDQTPVAVLRRNSVTSNQKGTLACALPWGFGFGWNTTNGIWGARMYNGSSHVTQLIEVVV